VVFSYTDGLLKGTIHPLPFQKGKNRKLERQGGRACFNSVSSVYGLCCVLQGLRVIVRGAGVCVFLWAACVCSIG